MIARPSLDSFLDAQAERSGQPLDPALRSLVAELAGLATGGTAPAKPAAPATTPGMTKAALQVGYDPRVLDASERAWLVDRSALIARESGRQLRMLPEERQRLLSAEDAAGQRTRQLDASAADDEALIRQGRGDLDALADAFLRGLARGWSWIWGHAVGMEPARQRALLTACEAMGLSAESSEVAEVADLRRRLALSELLDPMRMMIGLEAGSPPGVPDRFVGRETERAELRKAVDVLRSESVLESVVRFSARVAAAVTESGHRPRLVKIEAPGGLGKTALISKFILDHVARPDLIFPFAVLDFDRADLRPRSTELLLAEVARQLSLQPGMPQSDCERLAERIRAEHLGTQAIDTDDRFAELADLVRRGIARAGIRAFLVVLDTWEVVANEPDAVEGVIRFVKGLVACQLPELCLVVAGRSGIDIDRFEGAAFRTTALTLEPLSVEDARRMLDVLGRRLIGSDWDPRWSVTIAGRTADRVRREPLTLRLAVEILRAAPPYTRDRVVRDIVALGARAGETFVGALYERRVLDHIPDERARKLAWPGLVARRIDRRLATQVLAPLCGLTPREAGEGFDILSREGWVVTPLPDGTLAHRRDLRERTLPLMRQHRPKQFAAVIDTLIAHFSSPNGDPVEAAYYRFLGGRDDPSLDEVDDRVLSALAPVKSDFEVGSRGWALIEARMSDQLLGWGEFQRMPADLMWQHVARAGRSLRSLNDTRTEPRLKHLLKIGPPSGRAARDERVVGAWQAIEVKGGRWRTFADDVRFLPAPTQYDLTLFAFHDRALLDARMSRGRPLPVLSGAEDWRESNDYALAQLLGIARHVDGSLAERIEQYLSEFFPYGHQSGRLHEITLRLLLRLGIRGRDDLFTTWVRLERQRIKYGISDRELALIEDVGYRLDIWPSRPSNKYLDWSSRRRSTIIKDKDALDFAIACLDRLSQLRAGLPRPWLSAYFAVRRPDFIIPMAHLLASHLPNNWYHHFNASEYWIKPRALTASNQTDTSTYQDLALSLATADRGGALVPVVERLAQLVESEEARANIDYLVRVCKGSAADTDGGTILSL